MSVQIIINGENAKESLLELSTLAAGFGQALPVSPVAPVTQEAAPVTPAPVQQPSYTPHVQQPAPTQSVPVQPPVQQAPVSPAANTAVPVSSAPTYTIEQLGVAAGPLVDAGRGPELTGWLNQRGAAALTQLDKSQYGEFAIYLRSLGAKI